MHWEDLEGSAGEGGGRGGIGMGNTCKPMAVSFQCMTKFTTIKIKLNKILKKKKEDMKYIHNRILFSQEKKLVNITKRNSLAASENKLRLLVGREKTGGLV